MTRRAVKQNNLFIIEVLVKYQMMKHFTS